MRKIFNFPFKGFTLIRLLRSDRRSGQGFTLIELLVVVTIIGLVVGIGVPQYNRFGARGRDVDRQSDLKKIQAGLEQYFTDNGFYPIDLANINSVKSYLTPIPADPVSSSPPYLYQAEPSGCNNGQGASVVYCTNYCLFARVEDPSVGGLADGCINPSYNLAVRSPIGGSGTGSAGDARSYPTSTPVPTVPPTITPTRAPRVTRAPTMTPVVTPTLAPASRVLFTSADCSADMDPVSRDALCCNYLSSSRSEGGCAPVGWPSNNGYTCSTLFEIPFPPNNNTDSSSSYYRCNLIQNPTCYAGLTGCPSSWACYTGCR